MRLNWKRKQHGRGGLQIRLCPSCIAPALLFSAALMVAGCTGTTADHAPTSVGGLPGDAPAQQTAPSAYPAVNAVPPPRGDTLLSSEEQKKLEDELAQARNRAAAGASADAAAAGKDSASK